jgi:hypothetical protein
MKEEIMSKIEKMHYKGVIRESKLPCSLPAILVPKNSPDGKPKFRFCVDF